MKSLLTIISVLFISASSLFAVDFYVNQATGNDEENMGKSSQPFKTISRAFKSAEQFDRIFVEGKHEGKSLIYKENVVIPEKMIGIQLIGNNKPVIDGDFQQITKLMHNGISVYTENANISGFKIQNFTLKMVSDEYQGAAIYLGAGTAKHIIFDNEFENCNFGLFMYGNIMCEIYNNKFFNIRAINKDGYEGTGLMLYPYGPGIEANAIGKKGGNLFDNCETYGICVGADSISKKADLTYISNNKIKNSGVAGVAFLQVFGIIELLQNEFSGNYKDIEIEGPHYDTFIGENKFYGSTGPTLIEADHYYNGSQLLDIWKNNENIFLSKSSARMRSQSEEILPTKTGYYLRNGDNALKLDSGEHVRVHVELPKKEKKAKID